MCKLPSNQTLPRKRIELTIRQLTIKKQAQKVQIGGQFPNREKSGAMLVTYMVRKTPVLDLPHAS